jgi:hypothetical protein
MVSLSFRLLAVPVAVVLLVGGADAQQRPLTDEECHDLRVAKGAAVYRPITGEKNPARQADALRSTWGIGDRRDDTPAECRNRPMPAPRRATSQPATSERLPAPAKLRPEQKAGTAKCTTKQYGTGAVTVCE